MADDSVIAFWILAVVGGSILNAYASWQTLIDWKIARRQMTDRVILRVARRDCRRELFRLFKSLVLIVIVLLSVTLFREDISEAQVRFRNWALLVISLLLALASLLDIRDRRWIMEQLRREERLGKY